MTSTKPTNEKPLQETIDFKAYKSVPAEIKIALYKSKIEELELKLAVLRRSKEQNEPTYISRKLVDVITNVVYLKNYLLIKKETLREMTTRIEPSLSAKADIVGEIRKRESQLIADYDACVKDRGLNLYIFKLKRERLGQRYEIKILPECTTVANDSEDKELYYPRLLVQKSLTTRN
jgi:hypothetical protein